MTNTHDDRAPGGDGIDLAALRARLAGAQGPQFWRSLEQLAETPEFLRFAEREFPAGTRERLDAMGRREFLKLMAASVALAGVSGCAYQPPDHIVPYVEAPEDVVPGVPQFYATAMPLNGYGVGLLVESWTGRPIKVEGNPDHPASLGATDTFSQASLLGLYDPGRSQVVTRNGRISTWDDFLVALITERANWGKDKGARLRLLTEPVTSPTLLRLIRRMTELFPEARWHAYAPVGHDNARAGARLAFGEDVEPFYRVEEARVILSLECDLFGESPGKLVHARRFAEGRDPADEARMNRLYVAESTPTITGGAADHRLPIPSHRIVDLAHAIASRLGVEVANQDAAGRATDLERWIVAVADDLKARRGAGLVVAGDGQPPEVHALVHAMNDALGNVGKTVEYRPSLVEGPNDQLASLRELVTDIEGGKVDALIILGGNPAYDAPVDFNLPRALESVRFSVRLGQYEDETSALCLWHIPEAHYLETWGDVRAYDGTATIQQPLIRPLFDGKAASELLAAINGSAEGSAREIVRETWRGRFGDDFESRWRKSVHDGIVADTATEAKAVTLRLQNLPQSVVPGDVEVVFRPDPTIYDGRFANNGWLQELPKPLTKVTWDNAALLSPATSEKLGVGGGDVIELITEGRSIRCPVYVLPGQAQGTITVTLGYGRTRAGQIGSGAGFNAYAIRTSTNPWTVGGVKVRKTGDTYALATTQDHHSLEGRSLVRAANLDQYRADPAFAQTHEQHTQDETLYDREYDYVGHGWGMAINLNACIGCGACVVACQAENNIPIVGKEGILRSREMHWLEVDRYFEGDIDDPQTYFQVRLCMHCEQAPCEPVCPVEATLHDHEGLNLQVYNRCVGTRYCSNNCPYKVRHFNFFGYNEDLPELSKMIINPNVTVRSAGVMEKCTYCVQRIKAAEQSAEVEGRELRRDEVVTACQGACPTRAIVFGDIKDRESEVARLKATPLNYAMLAELNTRPRTTYLAKVHNPNPALATEARDGGHAE